MKKQIIKTILLSSFMITPFVAHSNTTYDDLQQNIKNHKENNRGKSIQEHYAGLAQELVQSYNRSVNKEYNLVNIDLSQSKTVMEDYLQVSLKAYEKGEDREEVQKNLLSYYNKSIEEIQSIAKDVKNINNFEVKNNYFRVYPQQIYDKKGVLQQTIWNGEAVITIGGMDIEKVGKVATNLKGFTISHSDMQVSDTLREKTNQELQSIIVDNFKERAKLLSKDFGFNGIFTIKQLNVNYSNNVNNNFKNAQFRGNSMVAMEAAPAMYSDNDPLSTIPSQVNITAHMNGTIILGDLLNKQ